MQTNYIQYKSSEIFYRTTGAGKPVILLHGFGEDGDIWQNQIEFLKNDFRLIIPDLPGSGKSDFLMDANIETYNEIVNAIIEQESIQDKIVFLGHSMGGYIALSFAENHPEKLQALGLIHSSAFADPDEKKVARKKSIEFIETNGSFAFLKTAIPGLFTKEFNEQHNEVVSELVERGKTFTKESLIQYYNAMIERPDRIPVLTTAGFPVLFIIGEFDMAVPLDISLQQCHLPSVSHVTILNKTAHMGMLEETEKMNITLRNFLTAVFN